MKKKAIRVILVSIFFLFCSCKGMEHDEKKVVENTSLCSLDNSLDAYSQTRHETLEVSSLSDGSVHTDDFISMNGEKVLLYEIFHNKENDNWTRKMELFTPAGLQKTVTYGDDDYHLSADFFSNLGCYYVFFLTEDDEPAIEIYDDNNTLKETLLLGFLGNYTKELDLNLAIAIDSDFCLHTVLKDEKNTPCYMIFSKDCELLYTKSLKDLLFSGFTYMPDGTVIIRCSSANATLDSAHTLMTYDFCVNPYTEEETLLFQRNINDGRNISSYCFISSNSLVYANPEGLFLCNTKMDNEELIYKWPNHGLSGNNLVRLSADSKEKIHLLLTSPDGVSYDFYTLEPTISDVKPVVVEFVVEPKNKEKYKEAVALFNKQHPAFSISLIDDYNETVLYTKLIASDGPVIIDTDITGFYEKKDLWMNLNSFFEAEEFNNEFNEEAMSLGSIDGELYGIVTDYYIDTLVAKNDKRNWSYKDFLEYTENETLLGIEYSEYNEFSLVLECFGTSENDSFFIEESGHTLFHDECFDRLITQLDRYNRNYHLIDSSDDFDSVLCRILKLHNPAQLYAYHQKYENYADFVGYPSYHGSVNRLIAENRIVIRNSASVQEKEIALSFMKMLLSYEIQKTMIDKPYFSFSVRKDVLQDQIQNVKKDSIVIMEGSDSDVTIKTDVDAKALEDYINLLLASAVPVFDRYTPYSDILLEEFQNYFSGLITKEMLANNLDNRINLYLSER